MAGTGIGFSLCRRGGEMQHGVGNAGQPGQTAAIVEISQQWHRPQPAHALGSFRAPDKGEHAKPPYQPGHRAQGNIATSDDKNSFHSHIISRPMPYQISLQPGGQTFSADADQTILEAALEAGLLLPYSCRDGACGACKGRVVSGEFALDVYSASALSDTERDAGMSLFCRTRARSNMVLEARNVSRAGDIPVKKLPCRVQKLTRVAADVIVLELKLPASEPFRFNAGQYVDILLPDGARRSFSIANAPHDNTHIELHVRLIEGGRFTGQVFSTMKERDILRFEGPLGSFWLREGARPIVMVAGGTGFAPIKGMIEHAIHTGITRPITLYWGARRPDGLYMDELARSWATDMPGFCYVPVISDDLPEDCWTGRRGLVHEAVLADFPDLSTHEVYACGAPPMIDAARRSFVEARGLAEDAFFADAFTFATQNA
jgi:CDP-4-dehydro-6-deoxyglucose reductase